MQSVGALNVDDTLQNEALYMSFIAIIQKDLRSGYAGLELTLYSYAEERWTARWEARKMYFFPEEFYVQSYECECNKEVVCDFIEEMVRGVPPMIDQDFIKFVSQLVPDCDEATIEQGHILYDVMAEK